VRQETFGARGEARWQRTEESIRRLERRDRAGAEAFPALYAALCHDLAVARDRFFDVVLVERLNRMALRAHQQIYRGRSFTWSDAARFAGRTFPAAVRAHAAILAVALTLFAGAIVGTAIAVHRTPGLVYSILPPEVVRSVESMYDPGSDRFLKPVDSGSRFEMFGYYIANNIGIGFRVFAGGVLVGAGSILVLLYNGVFLGAVAGHLVGLGFGPTFFTFVCGHSALELGAIVLLAVAGLRLGWSLVAPGSQSRGDSLRSAARDCVPLVPGAAAILVLAAIIEAFWSPLQLPPPVKYGAGAVAAAAVVAYFVVVGRERGLRADQRRHP
jgi:uncharacterized membrane protein SpoIIM required for sporulation